MGQLKIGFSDEPVMQDALGSEMYFKALADFIRNCPTPMTVAVQGGWGTGKTTAMQIVKKKIEDPYEKDEVKLSCIWFDTWKYAKSSGNNLILPLYYGLFKEVLKMEEELFGVEKCDAKKIIKDTVYAFAGVLRIAGKGILERSGVKDTVDEVGKTFAEQSDKKEVDITSYFDTLEKIREDMERRIGRVTEKLGNANMVVFIDDLDRLVPEDAVSLLEDLKSIMNIRNCVFVLALDSDIVQKGLSKKYGEDISEETAKKFFDKIIQVPFFLPVSQYDVKNYIETLNAEWGGQEQDRMVLNADGIAEVLISFNVNNPRTIKRLLNTLLLYMQLEKQIYRENQKQMMSILVLQLKSQQFYNDIVQKVNLINREKNNRGDSLDGLKDIIRGREETIGFWDRLDSEFDTDGSILAIKEIFNNDADLFSSLLSVSMMTGGNEDMDPSSRVAGVKEILADYIGELFEVEGRNDDRGYITFDLPQPFEMTVTIATPGRRDHVNLNFKVEGNQNIFDIDDDCKERIEEKYRVEVVDNNEAAKAHCANKMTLVENGTFLRNIAKEDLKVVGEMLRCIKAGTGWV